MRFKVRVTDRVYGFTSTEREGRGTWSLTLGGKGGAGGSVPAGCVCPQSVSSQQLGQRGRMGILPL